MEALATEIEALEKMRTRWLLVNLMGFIIWDGFRIVDGYLINGGINNSLQVVLILGWLIWTLGFIQLTRLGFKAKKTKMAMEVLNDELVEHSRLKTWRFAFIVVVITQVVIVVLSLISIEISGMLAAEVSIYMAVVSAIAAFIYFERSAANG